jgi:hypothetical protein
LVVCFWVSFIFVPLSPIVVAVCSPWLGNVLPGWLVDIFPVGLRCVVCAGGCLLGAAYCLARLPGKSLSPLDMLASVLGYGVVLLYAYFMIGCLLLTGSLLVAAVVRALSRLL